MLNLFKFSSYQDKRERIIPLLSRYFEDYHDKRVWHHRTKITKGLVVQIWEYCKMLLAPMLLCKLIMTPIDTLSSWKSCCCKRFDQRVRWENEGLQNSLNKIRAAGWNILDISQESEQFIMISMYGVVERTKYALLGVTKIYWPWLWSVTPRMLIIIIANVSW